MSIAARPDLTERQREILDFLRAYRREHGFSPSVRDIQAAFGIASPTGVMCHLKALTRKGYIRHEPGRNRSITVVGDDPTPLLRELVAMAVPRMGPGGSPYRFELYLAPELMGRLRRLAGEEPG